MKFSIPKEQMMNGLQSVQNIVGSRTTLPILSNVLLRGGDGKLELTTTDLDVSVSCVVNVDVKKSGAFTVPVKKFFGIVRELSASELEVEVDEKNTCRLSAGASYYKLNGLAAEEFPPLPTFSEKKKIALPQTKMKKDRRCSSSQNLWRAIIQTTNRLYLLKRPSGSPWQGKNCCRPFVVLKS